MASSPFNARLLPNLFVAALVLLTSSIASAQTPVGDIHDPEKFANKPMVVKGEEKTDITARGLFSSAKENPRGLSKSDNPPGPDWNPPSAAGSGWVFAFAPYIYATGLSGTIGARGRTAEIDMSFGDVLKHTDVGFMGALDARRGRFVVASDITWIKLSEERDTPGGLFSTAKLGVNMFMWQPAAGYRIYDGKRGVFDLLGGVRLTSVETNLNFTSGALPGFDVSQRKTWAAPLVGAHGLVDLTPKFFLSTIFDVGGGFGTHVTGQFYGGGGYRICPRVDLVGGYRYLKNNYSDDNGFIFDTTMNGLLFGAKFKF